MTTRKLPKWALESFRQKDQEIDDLKSSLAAALRKEVEDADPNFSYNLLHENLGKIDHPLPQYARFKCKIGEEVWEFQVKTDKLEVRTIRGIISIYPACANVIVLSSER